MNPITLLQPPRIVFGNGCAPDCAALFAQRGVRRVLLVSTKSVVPQIDSLLAALKQAGCTVVAATPIPPEPTPAVFETTLQEARSASADAVLGIGGGSALDVAKLVAVVARGPQNLADILGINRATGRALFLVCLPTTAGSGSEVSPNAVLLDDREQLKQAAISPHLVPNAAFVDPSLTVSVPPAVTAATGMDALTHCIEAYANKAAHPIVDQYALQGIRLIAANLARAVRDGGDLAARGNLALGSLYGGLCLGPVNTAAVHALSNPLGARFHIAHGLANAVLLTPVLQFNLPSAAERYADVAVALGLERNGSAQGTAERGVAALANLSQACGVPQRLSELGVPRDAIPFLARSAMQVTRLLKNNLRPLTEADAVHIYEAIY
jgi:alcohol dehydrogenase class IV